MSADSPSSPHRGGTRVRPVLRPVLEALLVGTLLLSAAGGIARGSLTLLLSLAAAVSLGVALVLIRFGRTTAGSIVALAVPLACTAVAMWVGDGLRDVAIMVLPAVMLLGCLVFERPASTVLVMVTVGIAVVVGIAQAAGWLPKEAIPSTSPVDYLLAPLILAALGAVAELIAGELLRSEGSYREVFNATQEGICIHDAADGTIVDVNDRMLTLYGYRREDLPRLGFGEMTAPSPEHGPPRALRLLQQAAQGEPQFFEWPGRRADGREFWVEVTLRRSAIGGTPCVLAVVRDIDDRKRSAAQALQSEKLRSLGLLAGGVAHDFNNQLAVIGGLAQLVTLRAHEPAVVAAHAGQILEATRCAADLTGKLLAFARKGASRDEAVDVNALVTDTAELLRRSLTRRIDVCFEVGGDHLVVLGDPAQLANALLNLGINARDAMPGGGVLTIRTEAVELDGPAASTLEIEPGPHVAITVLDTGEGMTERTLASAFEPFFTTKPDGTGMGLAQVYGAARAHRGGVRATSRLGVGTEVTVYLPLVDLPSTSSSRGVLPGEVRLGLRVLMAEDEERLATATRLLLEQVGCAVEVCADGLQVVEAFRHEPAAYDVVLLDLAMPRLSGAEALAEIRRADPEARVVITSGYATGPAVERLLADGAVAFVPKPATLSALVRALRSAVAGERQHGPSSSR